MESMIKRTAPVVCFVANFKYLYKNFPRLYQQLRTKGNYKDEVLVITTLTSPTFLVRHLNKKNNVTILRFKKIKFDKLTEESFINMKVDINIYVKLYPPLPQGEMLLFGGERRVRPRVG